MLYRKASTQGPWLRPPLQPLLTLQQPLSYVSREHIADVFASQEHGRRDISVCFTGHRVIPAEELPALTERLDALLEALYQRGFRDFWCGGALGFDTLAAQRVLLLRNRHEGIRLCLAIPCSTQSARWNADDCLVYEQLLYAADETKVLARQYYEGCMLARNRYMVDSSALCLCYLHHQKGGTMYTALYATRQGIPLLNLAIPGDCERFLRQSKTKA